PLATALGFAVLAFAPTYGVVLIFQAVRRAGNYALARPARETLYTIVTADQRYKAKSFIDTFVYRGGDAVGATVFNFLDKAGAGIAGVSLTAIPLALIWGGVGVVLGAAQQRLAHSKGVNQP
ncbi:MFS transporter, partial [bacterium]|nr:MFS transporter [bacterium]